MADNRLEGAAAAGGYGGGRKTEEMVVVEEEEQPKEIMLFGVRVVVDSMRKVVSHNNLTDYQHTQDNHNHEDEDEDVKVMESGVSNKDSGNSNKEEEEEDATVVAGYTSADDAVHQSSSASGSRTERKRGVPWTEEEHRRFLVGLKKMGKGDWRRIARNFVKTRTPTQVASHAQKYYMRQQNISRRRRRSSLFDITTDTVTTAPMEKQQAHQQDNKSNTNASQSYPLSPPVTETHNISNFPVMPAFPMLTANHAALPYQYGSPIMENQSPGQGNQFINHPYTNVMRPVPFFLAPCTPTALDLSLRLKPIADSPPLPLKLSLPPDQRESSSRHFQARPSFNNEDKIIIVS